MVLIGSGIVNVAARVASGGDDDDLVELAQEQDRVEKSEYLGKGKKKKSLRLESEG